MKQCINCAEEIKDSAVFCPHCGTRQAPEAEQANEVEQTNEAEQINGTAQANEISRTAVEDATTESVATKANEAAQPNEAVNAATEEAATDSAATKAAEGAATEGTTATAPAAKTAGEAVEEPAPAPAEDASAKKSSFNTTQVKEFVAKNKVPVIVGAVVVVIVAIFIFVVTSGPISSNRLKDDLVADGFTSTGIVSSNYTNGSAYELSNIKIADTQQKSGTILGQNFEYLEVDFSATMKNESFETDFTAMAYYVKEGNEWVYQGSPDVITQTTTPLKGVEVMEDSALLTVSTTSDSNYTFEVADFQSDLNEENGVYTSTATQTATYDYWFATDTAKNSRTFQFDNEKGWVAQGEIEATDLNTTWKLSGKTFELKEQTGYLSDKEKNLTSTITFSDNDDKGNVTANYTIKCKAPESTSQYAKYHSVNLKGTAKGAPKHEFGKASFEVELNDSDKNVTLTLNSQNASQVAGQGTVNALRCDISTKTLWYESTGIFSSKDYYEISYLTFTEKAQ